MRSGASWPPRSSLLSPQVSPADLAPLGKSRETWRANKSQKRPRANSARPRVGMADSRTRLGRRVLARLRAAPPARTAPCGLGQHAPWACACVGQLERHGPLWPGPRPSALSGARPAQLASWPRAPLGPKALWPWPLRARVCALLRLAWPSSKLGHGLAWPIRIAPWRFLAYSGPVSSTNLIRDSSVESVLGPRPHVELPEPRASVECSSIGSNTSLSAPRALRTYPDHYVSIPDRTYRVLDP
jgi:hypothetical protein